jgi:hypothetical protein
MSNGALAGQWSSGTVVPAGSWADEAMVFPSSLTAGKSQITISTEL